jgi:hypothetical protein
MRRVGKEEDIGKAGREGPDQLSPEEMFERFREGARKVLNTPKEVIVERERQWKAAREKEKALRVAQGQELKPRTP